MFYSSSMELCNTPLSGSLELFPYNSLDKAVKSSLVFHNEAIKKVVTLEKPLKNLAMKLQCFQYFTPHKALFDQGPWCVTGPGFAPRRVQL